MITDENGTSWTNARVRLHAASISFGSSLEKGPLMAEIHSLIRGCARDKECQMKTMNEESMVRRTET